MNKRIADYNTLTDFVLKLESQGELRRVNQPISINLEITEFTDRMCKSGGPAILFENVKESRFPVLTNAFGSRKRMALALGVTDIEKIAQEISSFLNPPAQGGIIDRAKALFDLMKLGSYAPKTVKNAPCRECVMSEPDIEGLPVLKCWQEDGGRFLTLPVVITKDPETGTRNLGMYRMQVYDGKTTGMHWHVHKVGASHYRKYCKLKQTMPVAVILGGDPAITYSATAPLPENVDELLFAGFLRKRAVELTKCKTIDLEVPAESDFVIEGYVEPGITRMEGPFGDHTGYYSPVGEYPVFHITCITHREKAIYPATIVGKPPMEDCYIAKATERIFLPLLKTVLPELIDMNLPVEGVFHNIALISLRKQFPFHARKVMNALWGLGQLMFTKAIIVVDEDVDVQNVSEVAWRAGNNIDPRRDIMFVDGPVDVLNPAVARPGYGSKMGVDATRKWRDEGFDGEWHRDITMPDYVKKTVDEIISKLAD